jgi:hypothetical protein
VDFGTADDHRGERALLDRTGRGGGAGQQHSGDQNLSAGRHQRVRCQRRRRDECRAPNTNYATAGYIGVNVTSGGHALIRFDNLFGNGPHQIPYGSTITSATVSVYLSGVASGAPAAAMHRMLVPWQDTATYNSMTTSGPGIQHDNVESRTVADSYATVSVGGTRSFPVTATVQDWANGAAVYGWALWRNSTVNMNVTLSNNTVVPRRPLLTVTYTS